MDRLVHLVINGEEVVTTDNHPFYVQGRGFIEAGRLLVGDKLVSVNGENLFVEEHNIELTEEPVEVYNFNVDDAHTYFVGENAVWVHNAECKPRQPKSDLIDKVDNPDGSTTYTKNVNGKNISVKYSKEGYADFSPYSHPKYSNPVKIDMIGDDYYDFKAANKAIGLKGSKAPKDYTWHHMEDGQHMLLVRADVHNSFPHTGGASITRNRAF